MHQLVISDVSGHGRASGPARLCPTFLQRTIYVGRWPTGGRWLHLTSTSLLGGGLLHVSLRELGPLSAYTLNLFSSVCVKVCNLLHGIIHFLLSSGLISHWWHAEVRLAFIHSPVDFGYLLWENFQYSANGLGCERRRTWQWRRIMTTRKLCEQIVVWRSKGINSRHASDNGCCLGCIVAW